MARDSGTKAAAARSQGPGIRISASLRLRTSCRSVNRGSSAASARAPVRGDTIIVLSREAPMNDDRKPAPRRQVPPLMDRLGELCTAGRDSATYLWQVPGRGKVPPEIAGVLAKIKV